MKNSSELSLLEIFLFLKRYRISFCLIISTGVLLGFVSTFFMPRLYRSSAVVLPMGTTNNALMSLASELGVGGSPNLGLNSTRNILNIFNSRTFDEKVRKRFGLNDITHSQGGQTQSPATLWKMSVKEDSAGGTMIFSADSTDPEFSAKLINGIVNELQYYLNEHAMTDSRRNRIFVGQQLVKNRREILEASKDLSKYYQLNRISSAASVVDVNISIPGLDWDNSIFQLLPKEGVKMLEAKIGSLEVEKRNLDAEHQIQVVQGVPQQVYLEYLNTKRDLLIKINGMLLQQYEMAKLEEAKKNLSFQVLDWGIPNKEPYRPRVKVIVLLAFMTSFLLWAFWAVVYNYVKNPRHQEAA